MNAAINDWYCFSCVSNQAMRLVRVLYTNTKQARFLECVNVASRIPLAISVMLWKRQRCILSCELTNIIMFYISQYLYTVNFEKHTCSYIFSFQLKTFLDFFCFFFPILITVFFLQILCQRFLRDNLVNFNESSRSSTHLIQT